VRRPGGQRGHGAYLKLIAARWATRLCGPASAQSPAKAKTFLNGFKRQERVSAVVDFVMSGSRFKLLVPRDNIKLTFALSGVRTGRVARAPEEKSEPFGPEAAAFVTRLVLQHDVTIEVDAVDKSGAFNGTLFTSSGENVAVLLLENGLATVHGPSADQSRYANQLYSAETRAKAAQKNVRRQRGGRRAGHAGQAAHVRRAGDAAGLSCSSGPTTTRSRSAYGARRPPPPRWRRASAPRWRSRSSA